MQIKSGCLPLDLCDQFSGGGGGGGGETQIFFIRGCAILALNIAPINPGALPKKGTHKSGAPKQAGDNAENANIEI